jgi:hypothetical protein
VTVVIAWVRAVGDCEELVFASDSRLSGDGRNFDRVGLRSRGISLRFLSSALHQGDWVGVQITLW